MRHSLCQIVWEVYRVIYETVRRQWAMLQAIPRHPRKVTAHQLADALASDGYRVTKRTIERDLVALSEWFPLRRDDRSVPNGWSWNAQAPRIAVPGMSNDEALTFAMVERHLEQSLPTATVQHLKPYFDEARQHLRALPSARRARDWLSKIRSIPPSQPLIPPVVNPSVQHAVYEALLNDECLSMQYRKRERSKTTLYPEVHPLALVQRGPVIYLHAALGDRPGQPLRTFALHRVVEVAATGKPAARPPEYDLDREIALGTWGFGAGKEITLEALFSPDRAAHLYETPLAPKQELRELASGWHRLKTRVVDSPQLVWWLLGFGDQVEVLRPKRLRDAIKKRLKAANEMYSGE